MSRVDGTTGSFAESGGELPVVQALLLDEACNTFEAQWRGGGRPDILAAVLELPQAVRGAALKELIQLDVFYRRRCGEVPRAGDYAERFPELDPHWLASVFAVGASIAGGPTASVGGGSSAAAPATGSRVGDFELLEELDHGGMGVVYRARQVGLNREVALKMLLAGAYASPALRTRFLVEAESVAALEHPHIVRVFAFGENGRHPYLAMEYLPGGTLSQRLKKGGPMPAREAAELVAQLAEAVAHAHSRGVVHRDIKPGNVLFGTDGEPRLADFGLAKVGRADRNLSVTGQVLGTPAYMAPEQAAGKVHEVGTASDVYALGAVLYDVLTGRPPFLGDSHAVTLQKVIAEEPARPRSVNPSVPRDLETICLKCLEKEPARRYATAQALAVELGRFLRGEPVEARRAGRLERAVKWVRRNKAATAVGTLTALFLLAAVGGGVALGYSRTLEGKNRDLEAAKGEAEERRAEAEGQRGEAVRQRGRAKAEEILARQYLYVSRMTLAQQAERDNNPARVIQLLRSVIPEHPGQEDVRGFEWHHLWRKYDGEEARLRGHSGEVTGIAVSPDGLLIASSSADGTIKLWDAHGGEVRTLFGHVGRVNAVAFGRTGRLLASGGHDGTLRFWDSETGREMKSVTHSGPVTAVAVSPNGGLVASGSGQVVTVYDAPTGEPKTTLKHSHPVTGVTFSPDGLAVASVTFRPQSKKGVGEAAVWSAASGTLQCNLRGQHGRLAVAYSPDGSQVATCDALNDTYTISIHNARDGHTLFALTGHEGVPTQVAFDPAGKHLASGGRDRTVRVWNLGERKFVRTFGEEAPIGALAYSADGSRLLSGSDDRTVKVWSLGPAIKTMRAKGGVRSIAFAPDGQRLAVSCNGPGIVFDVPTGRQLASLPDPTEYARLAWSPDGTLIGPAKGFGLWDAKTGAVVRQLTGVKPGGFGAAEGAGTAFSADGRLFATVTWSDSAHVWDVSTGQVACHYQAPSKDRSQRDVWAVGVAFHPDGRQLAVATGTDNWFRSGTLSVADITTGRVVREFTGFRDCVFHVAFSPDGRLLAAACGEVWGTLHRRPGDVRVWEAASGREVFTLRGHSDTVFSLSFSSDGRRLVSGGNRWLPGGGKPEPGADPIPGEVHVWDLATGEDVWTLVGKPGDANAVAFSPCGRFLAAGGNDGIVTIFDGTPSVQTPEYRPLLEDREVKP